MTSYYTVTNLFKRLARRIFHPFKTLKAMRAHGVWNVVRVTFTGELLPPSLKHWAVAKGWPRKNVESSTEVISG